jgi:rsbT co-antagonist protein RsbR
LLDLVATLETSVIRLADGLVFVPVVGYLDQARSERLTGQLLHYAHGHRAQVVLLDISGVSLMNDQVGTWVSQTTRGLKLLGCQVVLSGVTAQTAPILVALTRELRDIRVVADPAIILTEYFRTGDAQALGLARWS